MPGRNFRWTAATVATISGPTTVPIAIASRIAAPIISGVASVSIIATVPVTLAIVVALAIAVALAIVVTLAIVPVTLTIAVTIALTIAVALIARTGIRRGGRGRNFWLRFFGGVGLGFVIVRVISDVGA